MIVALLLFAILAVLIVPLIGLAFLLSLLVHVIHAAQGWVLSLQVAHWLRVLFAW